MDTSKQYILMCEKAEEIQKQRKGKLVRCCRLPYKDGDCFKTDNGLEIIGTTLYNPTWYQHDGYQFDIPTVGYDEGDGYKTTKLIWLPRQDQLQEMIKENYSINRLLFDVWSWHTHFGEKGYGNGYASPRKSIFDSMEQLWLAFVMKEKYNKRWNGREWEVKK